MNLLAAVIEHCHGHRSITCQLRNTILLWHYAFSCCPEVVTWHAWYCICCCLKLLCVGEHFDTVALCIRCHLLARLTRKQYISVRCICRCSAMLHSNADIIFGHFIGISWFQVCIDLRPSASACLTLQCYLCLLREIVPDSRTLRILWKPCPICSLLFCTIRCNRLAAVHQQFIVIANLSVFNDRLCIISCCGRDACS